MHPVSKAPPEQLAAVFGDKPTGSAARTSVNSHVTVYLDPSSERGPERTWIPVSGYNLVLEIVSAEQSVVLLESLSARVLGRVPLQADGVAVQPVPDAPALVLAEDLAAARQRSLAAYRPLEPPHLEVLVDYLPPMVRPAEGADGKPVRGPLELPLEIAGGSLARLVLAPVTDDRRWITWELAVGFRCDGAQKTFTWEFGVTAETTFRTFHPDGRQETTPVQDLAQHWFVREDARGTGA